jgi:hypothetical protein
MSSLFKESGDTSKDAELKKYIIGLLDEKIKNLEGMNEGWKAIQKEKAQYQTSAAVIPGQEVSDRLIRYEAHLSREFDRTLNQLERLQRIRKGQPLPPQFDVKIS